MPLTNSLSLKVVSDNAIVFANNAKEDIRLKDNAFIEDLHILAYLGVPVHDTCGWPLGSLAVIDSQPRNWTEVEFSTLKRLAACITDAIKLKSSFLDKETLRSEQAEFNYSISHDLKSPVNTLHLLLTEIAEMHRSGNFEDSGTFVNEALNTTHRMHVMIEDTLDYIQVTNAENIQRIPVSLETTITNIKNSMAKQISDCNATITSDKLPSLMADPELMHILFHQLISNAIKFRRPHAPPEINIRYETCSDEQHYKIVVSDNGIGINDEYHTIVFNLYSRLHTREQYTGTGLGLSICRRIVSFYGGRISIEESVPQKPGTSFNILLPRDASVCLAA